ncbi:YggT family protein [Kozakia baliensis]|uniref:YggT family protein n=1 Tax=Kozakia baliensis TaxID=153496 RepID=UPI000496525C|nr:YggT family protein [Kozakia baliensis]
MLIILYKLVMLLIQVFTWALLLSCLMSMLLAFGVLDPRNRVIYNIAVFLNRVTEPVLAPVRNILPQFGNVDFSPLVVLLLLQYVLVPAITRLFWMALAHTA